jgi:hypothetical protein
VELEPDPARPPADVRRFLREARRRVWRLARSRHLPAFAPSDFGRVYAALRALEASALLPGLWFCEWGSGLGVVSCLAALLGFEARGIEAEGSLVEAARRLAGDFALEAEFARGNYLPDEARGLLGGGREFAWLSGVARSGYEALGLDLDEFDLVFAYPWPDEAGLVAEVFEGHARAGALLLTYHPDGQLQLRQKSDACPAPSHPFTGAADP